MISIQIKASLDGNAGRPAISGRHFVIEGAVRFCEPVWGFVVERSQRPARQSLRRRVVARQYAIGKPGINSPAIDQHFIAKYDRTKQPGNGH